MKKEVVNFRQKAAFPMSTKIRNEVVDYDYVSKLNKEEKKWLRQFTNEYYQASFKKNPTLQDKNLEKKCYIANNGRNRDTYGIAKATNRLYLIATNTKEDHYGYLESLDDSDYVFALTLKSIIEQKGVIL